jgi:hypothetical protein
LRDRDLSPDVGGFDGGVIVVQEEQDRLSGREGLGFNELAQQR